MFDWDRIWRGSGVIFVVLIIVAFFVYGDQPKLGASDAKLVSFYDGDRTRILIASVIFCFAFLELLWFGAALASVLRDAGKGGWGAAAIASSAALGAMLFVRMTVRAALAFSIATWASDGFWAPDGAYALISQIILFAWIAVLSGFLVMQSTVRAPERAAVPAA